MSSGDDPKYFGQPMHDLGAAHPGEPKTLEAEFEAWNKLSDEAWINFDRYLDEILVEHAGAWQKLRQKE